MRLFRDIEAEFERLPGPVYYGKVEACTGQSIRAAGLDGYLSPGDRCEVTTKDGRRIQCEVIGFEAGKSLLLPFEPSDGIVLGSEVLARGVEPTIHPDQSWIGRVVNASGTPIDGKGVLARGPHTRRLRAAPLPAYARRRVGTKIDTGIRAIDVFAPICRGQRMGVFAGSGVGKSTLLSMLARRSEADVAVIGLIGERGREVQEFIQETLGEEGLARSVMVVATSDESPHMRRQAAYMAMAIAEAFRDEGLQVFSFLDSVTRFAMAQREIGLASGEPPTAKGYPPSVFSELARLLERAGPGADEQGDISGVFTVLVEGDDHNDPVADAVRSILDGHLVLDRVIAERGRFPPIDLLKSVSRMLPGCHTERELRLSREARSLIAAYEEMRELIQIGAYKAGSDPRLDRAIVLSRAVEEFLAQAPHESHRLAESFAQLENILNEHPEQGLQPTKGERSA
ncbi:MAG: flagellar protein export ATPase FliI [Parvibaculum sp.]